MSDEQKPRTKETLGYEAGQLIARAGSLQYQIAVFKDELALVIEALKDLNLEMTKLPKEERAKNE